ncbi:MAG: alpha/beta fold hydrolase, partial [Hyphomonadaceae bacterium]
MKFAKKLIFCCATALALAIAPAREARATPVIAWTPYAYELNSGAAIESELGALDVPAHRGAGEGVASIGLRFVRIPAARPNAGLPIIYLAGGPGSSGIEAGRGDRWMLIDALRQEGDVILLDQRGVGLSSAPPPCSTPWTFPNDQASTEVSFNASLEAGAAVCAAEWRAAGIDLSAFNTAENASDVADLARALGGRVRLVGISYGTFLAFAVLRDHHDLIDSVVLAGIEGPDNTLKLPLQADAALEALARRVAADPAAAALTPDLRASVARVLDRLEQMPVWAEVRGRGGVLTRL